MFSKYARWSGLLCSWLLALDAGAQDVPDAGEPPPALSEEERREIEAAVGSDAGGARGHDHASDAPEAPPAAASPVTAVMSALQLDLSFILDVAAAAFSSRAPLQTGAHDPRARGFNLQQFELSIGAAVDPYFRFDGNLVFSQFGVEIEEAYATSLDLPGSLQLRAGQFLTRFGRLNNTHPHSWEFVDQPFALGRTFGGEGNRGLGFELSWLTPLPWYAEVLGSVTDASGAATARSFFGAGGTVESPLDFQFTGALKQFFPLGDDASLLWGLSAATGPNATGYRNRTDVFGMDLYFKYRPVTVASNTAVMLQAEGLLRRRQVPGDVLQDAGAYAQLVWYFAARWSVGGRYELGTAARGRGGGVALDVLDPDWTEDRHRLTASTTFKPTEFSRIRLQGASDLVGWRSAPEYSAFLAFEVVMGAHGAHAF